MKVYCAGPLFNSREKGEMAEIAQALEKEGFDVFLPQRDGLEFSVCLRTLLASGVDQHVASELLSRAIYALDVYQVVEACDGMVVNLNGRVPDEGAVAEAALAWYAGKAIVAYKSDVRSMINGSDNPLVMGLFGFRASATIPDAVECVKKELTSSAPFRLKERKHEVEACLDFGRRIWNLLRAEDVDTLVRVLLESQESRVQ